MLQNGADHCFEFAVSGVFSCETLTTADNAGHKYRSTLSDLLKSDQSIGVRKLFNRSSIVRHQIVRENLLYFDIR